MEKYLNMPVQEVIEAFPVVGKLLGEYGIGCVNCGAGSCLLKDIVDIHNVPEEDERAPRAEIARVIYPGEKVEIPALKRNRAQPGGKLFPAGAKTGRGAQTHKKTARAYTLRACES